MKIPSIIKLSLILLAVGMASLAWPTAAMAQALVQPTLEQCLSEPTLTEKQQQYVRQYQLSWAKQLVKAGFQVEMMRSREVIVILFPSHQLFKPGGAEFTAMGSKRLQSLVGQLGTPGTYRVAVVGYTDNTGSQPYCLRRSGQWAKATADWLREHAADGIEIVDFGRGNENPLLPNNSVANRAVNRRIEILLIPAQGLIDKAK